MLLFEFDGSLFQFDAREPALPDSSQFSPKIDASVPTLLSFNLFYPRIEHRAALADLY